MSNYKTLKEDKFKDTTNIVDTGTEGTKIATGTTAQRGSTAGQIRFNSDTGLAEYYDGASFKSIDAPPEINSISPSSIDENDLSSSQTIVISGANFSANPTVTIIGNDTTVYSPVSTTRNSTSQITITTPTTLTASNEPYSIKVVNLSGLAKEVASLLSINDKPVFSVASGSLGSLSDSNRSASNLTAVTATDEESDAITFSQTAGTLPTGITFNSNGTWSGTANQEVSTTTYNFTITATSGGQTATRNYTITVQSPPIVEYLVIAGGGAGSGDRGGGGGAGGYRNSYASETSGGNSSTESPLTLSGGTTYTITVGAGGTGTSGSAGEGTAGSNSVFSTITSIGGGQGGFGGNNGGGNGYSGGSGGGARNNTGANGGSGTSNQGTSGGNNPVNDGNPGGGGGGAGQSGTNGGTSGGHGGNGLSSSITGSAVTRAGGGGSGGDSNQGINGSGGAGGGGNGGLSTSGTNATVNTGSGGGGGGNGGTSSGNGGSGIVILRMLSTFYTGTTTGNPTVTDDGSYKVLTYTGSGSYTA